MPPEVHRAKRPEWLRVDPADLLLEVLSIVIAILLALAVNAWNDGRKTQQSVHDSLINIRREIAGNRDRLVPLMLPHHRFHDAYWAYLAQHRQVSVDDFYELYNSVASHGFNPFIGETSAWDIARSLPSAEAIPYQTRVAVEKTYAEQDFLRSEGFHIIEDIHLQATDEHPNLFLPAYGLAIDSSDVVASERRLRTLYDGLLMQLPQR